MDRLNKKGSNTLKPFRSLKEWANILTFHRRVGVNRGDPFLHRPGSASAEAPGSGVVNGQVPRFDRDEMGDVQECVGQSLGDTEAAADPEGGLVNQFVVIF